MRQLLAKMSMLAVLRTGLLGALCIVIDAVTIACTFGITLAIAGYFGHEAFDWHLGILERAVDRQTIYLIAALFFSTIAIVARLGHSIAVARITVTQEMWYAAKLRRARQKEVNGTVIARSSNHYGRFAASSIRMYSGMALLVGSILLGLLLLPNTVRLLVLLTLAVGAVASLLVFLFLARAMARSSRNLVHYARHTSRWKTGATSGTSDVRAYTKAYFMRLFLPGLFGLSPMIFAALATVFLMVLRAQGITVDLASAFIGFVIAQAYLGLIGKVFDEAMKLAAFAPAVTAVWSTIGPAPKGSVANAKPKPADATKGALDELDL